MSDKMQYIVALKLNGKISMGTYGSNTYIKARPVGDQELVSMAAGGEPLCCPEKGRSYINCNLITSLVVDFKPFRNGWEVQTENSLYRFFIADMDEIERLAEESNFSGPRRLSDVSRALYWG